MGFGIAFSILVAFPICSMDELQILGSPGPVSSKGPLLSEEVANLKSSLNQDIRKLLYDIPSSLRQMTSLESRIQMLILYNAGEAYPMGGKARCPRVAMVAQEWLGLKQVKKAEETKYVFKRQNYSNYITYLENEMKLLAERKLLLNQVRLGLKNWVFDALRSSEDNLEEIRQFGLAIDQWVESVSSQNETIEDFALLLELLSRKQKIGGETEEHLGSNLKIFLQIKYIFDESLIRRAQLLYERILPLYLDLKSNMETLRRFYQELKRENDVKDQLSKKVDEELKVQAQTPSSGWWFSWKNSKAPHPKIDISPTILMYGKFPPYKNPPRTAKRQDDRPGVNDDGPDDLMPIVAVPLERAELIGSELQDPYSLNEKVRGGLARNVHLSALLEEIKSFRNQALCFGVSCFKADAKGGVLKKPAVRFAHHLMWNPGAFVRTVEKLPRETVLDTLLRYFAHYEQLIEFFTENVKRPDSGYLRECLLQLGRHFALKEKKPNKEKVESAPEKEDREKENYRRQLIAESFFTTDYIEHWILAHYTFGDIRQKQYFVDNLMQHLLSRTHSPFYENYSGAKSLNDQESYRVGRNVAKEILLFRVVCEAIAFQRPMPKIEDHEALKETLFKKWLAEDPQVKELLRQARQGEISVSILEENKVLMSRFESLFREILNKCLKLLRLDEEKIEFLTQESRGKTLLQGGAESLVHSNLIYSSVSEDGDGRPSPLMSADLDSGSSSETVTQINGEAGTTDEDK